VHEMDIADVSREQKLLYREHENATRATKNTPRPVNEVAENECLRNFELNFNFLEKFEKTTDTQKYEKTH